MIPTSRKQKERFHILGAFCFVGLMKAINRYFDQNLLNNIDLFYKTSLHPLIMLI